MIYVAYVDRYYRKLKADASAANNERPDLLSRYMKREVYTLPQSATVRDAIAYFSEKNISGAPIVAANGSAADFISDGDIMRYLRADDCPPAAMDSSVLFMDYFWNAGGEFEQKLNAILDFNVLDIGTDKPITIPENATLEDACRLLSKAGVKKVPVVNGEQVVGIISRSAITHYLTRRYLQSAQKHTSP